jgi:hypothetical protein
VSASASGTRLGRFSLFGWTRGGRAFNFLQGSLVYPVPAFLRVVSRAKFELLKELNQPRSAKALAQRCQPFAADFIKCAMHGIDPVTIARGSQP